MDARHRRSVILAGAVGALVALIAVAVVLGTGVLNPDEAQQRLETPAAVAAKPSTGAAARGQISEIYARTSRSVVTVEAKRGGGGDEPTESPFGPPRRGGEGTATGSGFVIDRQGSIVTNAHVVSNSRDVKVRFNQDDDTVPARVVGSDPSTDVAVLRVDPDKTGDTVRPLELADSGKVRVGDLAVAIGNPFGLDRTATAGIVSALGRPIEAPNGFSIEGAIQTDAAINPGNSGGPLLDGRGQVIGINSQIRTDGSNGNVGIGFAVSSNTVRDVVPKLERNGRIERAYIGVQTSPVTGDVQRELRLTVDRGALVRGVSGGSPAADAGLRGNQTGRGSDVLVSVDGEEIREPQDVADAIDDNKPGDKVKVEYLRGSDRRETTLTLAARPARAR